MSDPGQPIRPKLTRRPPRIIPSPTTLYPDPILTTQSVGLVLGLSHEYVRRMVDRNELGPDWFQPPFGQGKRITRSAFLRHLLLCRNALGLKAMGWQPTCLLVGTGTRLASDLKELVRLPEVIYASDWFSAGVLTAKLEPVALVTDLALGEEGCANVFNHFRHHRPWVRLVGLSYADSVTSMSEVLADRILSEPFGVTEIVEVLIQGIEDHEAPVKLRQEPIPETPDWVWALRRDRADGVTHQKLADKYGISRRHVIRVLQLEHWK